MLKRVIIVGGTGFIGRALCRNLIRADYDVVLLSRRCERPEEFNDLAVQMAPWNPSDPEQWSSIFHGATAVVNLAGENIAAGRWTRAKKQRILESRVNAAAPVIKAVRKAEHKPEVVIQASAVGYYGDRGEEMIDENSTPGSGFLAEVCRQWEEPVSDLSSCSMRFAIIRIGPVLGTKGGFLPRVLWAFDNFLGGHPGNGKQWFSWIHIEDVVAAVRFLIENPKAQGVFNLTAPQPVRAKDFYRLLGKFMQRPSFAPMPGLALKLFLGDMARELLLAGSRVFPRKLLRENYSFRFDTAESALKNLVENYKSQVEK